VSSGNPARIGGSGGIFGWGVANKKKQRRWGGLKERGGFLKKGKCQADPVSTSSHVEKFRATMNPDREKRLGKEKKDASADKAEKWEKKVHFEPAKKIE